MHIVSQNNQFSDEKMIDIGKYFLLIKRNWWKITFFSFLVTMIAVLVALSMTPKYVATATLLLESESKNAVSIEEVVGIDPSRKGYYQTQFEILKSRQVAERVINELELRNKPELNASLIKTTSLLSEIKTKIKALPLFATYNQREELSLEDKEEQIRQSVLAAFQSRLSISPIAKTQLVNISFESTDPKLAAEIANAVGQAYIEENMYSRLTATQTASSWISKRLSSLQAELKASEATLTEFLTEEKLIDDSGIDGQASSVIKELNLRLNEITDKRIELESAYSILNRNSSAPTKDLSTISIISSHPQVISLRTVLADADKDVTELSKKYGPLHDKMVAATAKRDNFQSQLDRLVSQLVSGVGKELAAVRKQESLVQNELDKKVGEFQLLSVKKRQYQALLREVETNRNIMNVFLNRQKETSATSDFQAENARFTDVALIPQVPAKPNKKLLVLLAAIGSVVFAICVIILLDVLRNTIESVKQFEERMGLVPLGGIPKLKSKKFKKKNLDSSVFSDPKAMPFTEAIRSVRTALTLSSMRHGRKCLAVTSSLPNEGKTTCAINIAMAFSQMEKVLLIDTDLRKPSVAERFGFNRYQQGLTNHLLMGVELNECVIQDENTGIAILPAGMPTSNPQELLSSDSFAKMLAGLENKYDRIVIDTPPTLPVNDSLVISKLIGSVVIVVKANSTRIASLKNTMARFIGHDVKIDGVIINQIQARVAKNEYDYKGYGDIKPNQAA